MGNHEFNAISYATRLESGEYARPYTEKNRLQHQAFLDAFPFASSEHAEAIRFFKSIPLWLDMGAFRVVHACWHEPSMHALKPFLNHANCIADDRIYAWVGAGREPLYSAVETILKGPEVKLPEGAAFADTDGNMRDSARINWWKLGRGEEHAFAINRHLLAEHDMERTYNDAMAYAYDERQPAVFFGHYWQVEQENEAKHQANSACLDWSVAKGGRLRAYRWNGSLTERGWF